jgi:hypothetical protein
MGTRDILPADLLEEMIANGVKFDEDGEIIEDNSFLSGDEADTEEDQNEETSDESSEDDSEEASDEDDSDDDSEEADEDEPKVTKLARKVNLKKELADEEEVAEPKIKLTPKVVKQDEETSSELFILRRELAELKALIAKKPEDKATDNKEDYGAALREEAARFKQMRLRQFANNVELSVNAKFPDTTFKEIIASAEWEEYQNSRVMGSRVGDLYIATVKSEEPEDVISFFDDFVDRFLPSKSKAKPVAAAMKKVIKKENKPDLKDLAVPDKAKAAVTKPTRSGFDFTASDYQKMLDKAERGQITLEDFTKFETKFLKAEKEGRVKND